MIALDNLPQPTARCPVCAGALISEAWSMPGMRALAQARCMSCDRRYYADLPVGQALYSPMLLDAEDGVVHDPAGVAWYAAWLRDAYAARINDFSPSMDVERRQSISRPVVLLNCLDTLYGHCLLKLLNAQQYLDADTHDVVVIVQSFLQDLVPNGVAECWTVDLPLRLGTLWSDTLATRIATEVERIGDVSLAPVPSHPHPSTFAIERFSRVAPFPQHEWRTRRATVTFVWRDDRVWCPRTAPLLPRLGLQTRHSDDPLVDQKHAVLAFLTALRRDLPDLDAAVVGLGAPGGLPDWIDDLRQPAANADIDRVWLHRYAASHLVVGVHGSNMLLPTAHAGGAIELIDEDRHGNFLQDILFNGADARDLFFRYRFITPATAPDDAATLAAFIIRRYPEFDALMGAAHSHDPDAAGGGADVRD